MQAGSNPELDLLRQKKFACDAEPLRKDACVSSSARWQAGNQNELMRGWVSAMNEPCAARFDLKFVVTVLIPTALRQHDFGCGDRLANMALRVIGHVDQQPGDGRWQLFLSHSAMLVQLLR